MPQILLGIFIVFILVQCSSSDEDSKPEKTHAERQAEERKGFHCLSGWDGSHTGVKRKVKDILHDPDSFEHVQTRITPVDSSGNHDLIMDYRATNGFGASRKSTAVAIVNQSTCRATLISAE